MKKLFENKKIIVTYLVPIIIISLAIIYYIKEAGYIGTDNAYVKAEKIYISSEINGKVKNVLIKENESVKKKQALVIIDDEPYKITLNQAKANLSSVANSINILKSQYTENTENLKLAVINRDYAQRELYRAEELAKKCAGTISQVDAATNKLEGSKQQIAVLEQKIKQLVINLSNDPSIEIQNHPKFIEAKAEVDKAELNLRHTVIRAPSSGVASQVSALSTGDYIAIGAPIFSVILLHNIWIEANLKETDLTNVKVGQKTKVTIDAFPDLKYEGFIESIGAASGAEFSILPPQNATGNWVKIVQRIPVRISIKQQNNFLLLKAGMSAVIEIDTKGKNK